MTTTTDLIVSTGHSSLDVTRLPTLFAVEEAVAKSSIPAPAPAST